VTTTAIPPAVTDPAEAGADPPPTSQWKRLTQRVTPKPRPATATPPSAVSTIVVTVLALLSLLAVWLLAYALGLSGLQERSDQHRLYATIRYSLSQETAPLGGAIKPGTPVAVMTAPQAGLRRVVVVEGTTSGVLRDGPGHQQNTALPGQPGVSVIMGRSVTFGAPFRHVASMQVGATIVVTTGQGVFRYTVTDVRGNGDPLPPTLSPTASRLTLVTSGGSGWRDGWAPNHQVFVDATMSGHVQPAPSGRPATIALAATEMHADAGGLVALVLLLQGLLIVGVCAVWARARWGRWQAWLAITPVVLAILWVASSEALRLLPNLV
jgi:sortase A